MNALDRIRNNECGKYNQNPADYCKAGGVLNFYKLGVETDHENYGFPCVSGWISELGVFATNCVFCGKEVNGAG